MENARPRGRPREFDRGKALEAALRLFWERGFEPTSVADLCKAMEINPPSLYAAFGNKAQLFLEAARYYEALHWQEPAKTFMATSDIYQAVDNYFQQACSILLAPTAPCGCMVVLAAVNISASETEIIEEIKKMREATRKMFADRLRMAIEAGQIPAETDVPALSGAMMALLEGLSLQAREGLFLSELKAMAKLALRLLPQRHKGPSASVVSTTQMQLF